MAYKLLAGRCTLRSFFHKQSLLGCLALAAGILFSFGREIYYFLITKPAGYAGHLSGQGSYQPKLENFVPINVGDLIMHPFFLSWEDPSLWNLQV